MATAPSSTTEYNVYRVSFHQANSPDHVGIALVPAQNSDQGAGRFYHVKGLVGLGMEYEQRGAFAFSADISYKRADFVYVIAKTALPQWEAIARAVEAPHDPRALTEREPDPPVRNCTHWVDQVLQKASSSIKAGQISL